MKKEFLKYFVSTYIVCLLPVTTGIIPDETLLWFEKIGFIFLIPLIVSVFLAPLFYWLIPKLQIRHRRKKTKKKLFRTFIEKNGFKITDDGYVLGKIDGYIVCMYAAYDAFQSTKWIEVQIIFHPKRHKQYISQSLLNRLIRKYEGKHTTWNVNSVLIKKTYALKMPVYDTLFPLIKSCISDLKANQISPISHTEWTQMIPELKKHFEN